MKHGMLSSHSTTHQVIVSEKDNLERLDVLLAKEVSSYSRAYFQRLITDCLVTVNGLIITKAGYRVKSGDTVSYTLSLIDFDQSAAAINPDVLQGIAVSIVAEEPDFLIINKPAGLVVHQASSNRERVTLVDWLIAKYPTLKHIGDIERPGIVHRLDKDTSGLMIIPRTPTAHAAFAHMFKERLITKSYYALVEGHPTRQFQSDYRIMRHPTKRTMMAPSTTVGRIALTHFSVIDYLCDAALIAALPATGRTHQIRVHCAAEGFPIIGDTVYGTSSLLINRQALHAAELSFTYRDKNYRVSAPMPSDMRALYNALQIP